MMAESSLSNTDSKNLNLLQGNNNNINTIKSAAPSSPPPKKPRYGEHARVAASSSTISSSDRASQRLYKLLILMTLLSMSFMVFLNSNEIYQDVMQLQQHPHRSGHVSLHHGQDALRKAFIVESDETTPTTTRPSSSSKTTQKKEADKQKASRKSTGSGSKKNEDNSRLVELVERATGTLLDASLKEKLPPWSRVVELYGAEPVIFGLDSCGTFQKSIPASDAYVGPAGMFNTGTNLLAQLLAANCQLPKRTHTHPTGMRWQVPWGKHSPVELRLHNVAQAGGQGIAQKHVLAVVTTKDPYAWMGSMCRHSYAANWKHSPRHCPNLVPDAEADKGTRTEVFEGPHNPDHLPTIPVNVRFNPNNITHHYSLADLWNDWYGAYFDDTPDSHFPRLIIRFEDLLLHTETVISKVCQCGGGVSKTGQNFRYVTESAKGSGGPHSGSSGLISAILRYTNATLRHAGMQTDDLRYAATALRSDLLDYFHYPAVPVPDAETPRTE